MVGVYVLRSYHSLSGFSSEIEQGVQVVFLGDLGVDGEELGTGDGVSAFGGTEGIEEAGQWGFVFLGEGWYFVGVSFAPGDEFVEEVGDGAFGFHGGLLSCFVICDLTSFIVTYIRLSVLYLFL